MEIQKPGELSAEQVEISNIYFKLTDYLRVLITTPSSTISPLLIHTAELGYNIMKGTEHFVSL
jgi:hypothetical protein